MLFPMTTGHRIRKGIGGPYESGATETYLNYNGIIGDYVIMIRTELAFAWAASAMK